MATRVKLVRMLLVGAVMAGVLAVPVALHAQAADSAAAPKPKPAKPKANLISNEEIVALNGAVQTAYGVVQRLRPAMLRVRSGSTSRVSGMGGSTDVDATANEIQVYLDSQKMNGGVRALDEILVGQIQEIRYLSANDATTLFGTGNNAGAIQVISKR